MLKAIVDSIDGLPEAIRGEYRPGTKEEGAEGKFVLAVEAVGGFALEDVNGLKHVLQSERAQNTAMSNELKKFGSTYDSEKKAWVHTLDPKKAKDAIDKVAELSELDPEKEADKIASQKIEAAKSQLIEKHNEEIAELKTGLQERDGTIETLLVDNAARTALAEHKGSVNLLLPHIKGQAKVRKTETGYTVDVIDPVTGQARIADAKGTAMTISDLVKEMKGSDEYGRAFEASGNSGSGMGGGGAGGKPPAGGQKGNLGGNKEERVAAIGSMFPDLPRK